MQTYAAAARSGVAPRAAACSGGSKLLSRPAISPCVAAEPVRPANVLAKVSRQGIEQPFGACLVAQGLSLACILANGADDFQGVHDGFSSSLEIIIAHPS